jgi:membrane protease subunit HflK
MRWLLYFVVVAFLLSLLSGLRMVEPGERAVIERFGRVLKDKPGPGLYVGLPWGIDRVTRVPVQRIRSVTIGYSADTDDESDMTIPAGQLVTGDDNVVNIQVVLNYVVREDEVEKFAFQQDRAEALLARAAEAVLSEWVATNAVDTVLLKGKLPSLEDGKKSLRDALVEQTQHRLDKSYDLGIEVQDARVTHLAAPAAVKDAFDEVDQAETKVKTLEHQAREYATFTAGAAKQKDDQIKQSANMFYNRKTTDAQGQAKSFEKWVALAKKMKADDPYYLNTMWWDQIPELYAILRTNGQIDLLDHRLGTNGLDFTIVPSLTPKK